MTADVLPTDLAVARTRTLLETLQRRLVRLESVLRDEQQHAAARQVEGLDVLLQEKRGLLQDLENLDRERRRRVARTGSPDDAGGMRTYLQQQNDSAELLPLWETVRDHLHRCQALNEANGAIIRRGLEQGRRLLDLLRGEASPPSAGYGPDGSTRVDRRRELGQA